MAEKVSYFREIEENIYLKLRNTSNDFEKANLMRQDAVTFFNEALSHSESAAALILEEHLQNYIPLVRNSTINNYAELLKKEINPKNLSNRNQIKFEPIKIDDITHLLPQSNLQGKFEDDKSKEIGNIDLEELGFFNNETNKTRNENVSNLLTVNPREIPTSSNLTNQKSLTIETDKNREKVFSFNDLNNTKCKDFNWQQDKNSAKQEIQNADEPDVFNDFRTSSMEYYIQNMKKNAGSSLQKPQVSSSEYGISKKSLGGKRSVRSKFVPPVKRTLEEMEEINPLKTKNENVSEQIDQRLKNIDPQLVEMINNEIMRTVTQTNWDDIAGLEYTKSVIQEAIVWPLLRPDIFTGLRRPPRGVLLFGPPGTGKTLIGKCIASQSKSTFFSISASSLTSKWIGEGEKMVRALFAVAAVHQPSVIFIDEIDSLLCQRSENEHESSRRIKTEFLVQLDGAATSEDEKILIVGATNRPQELDEAARRRLVRRLYVPLPEHQARYQMIKNLLSSIRHELSDDNVNKISELTDGYSGADIKTLCTEASLEPIRSIPTNLIPVFDKDNVRPVLFSDFEIALNRVRPSVSQNDLNQYIEWNKIYGSGNVSK